MTRPGFTVVEMLVAVTIFGLMAGVLVQTFLSFNRLHRRIANTAVLGQDARFAMELFVREARNKRIVYPDSGGFPDASPRISFVDPTGAEAISLEWLQGSTSTCGGFVGSCLALSNDGGATWNPLTSSRVRVTRFDVRVRPALDPFANPSSDQVQPFVDAVLGLEYADDDPRLRTALVTQTGVSSRRYER